jgi:hypothetical protein
LRHWYIIYTEPFLAPPIIRFMKPVSVDSGFMNA